MATIKSYTDLEQSKKLAEILPLETADYFYAPDAGIVVTEPFKLNKDDETVVTVYKGAIPCWSLAALLNVLPNNEHITTSVSRGSWQIEPVNYLPNTWWCEYENDETMDEFNVSSDNPVDACVEMILKLKKNNLI